MNPNRKVLTIAAVICTVCVAAVFAQNKVQGVKWRAKVTMQSKSFSMPERTLDLCLPANDPDQAAMQQGQQGDCKMSNFKRSGNKTSADMKCTGARPSETHWEMEKNGDTMLGTMTTKTADNTIDMKYNYTKVGGACEVQPAPVPGAMPQGTPTPAELQEQLKKLRESMGR